MAKVLLHGFHRVLPTHHLAQDDILAWLAAAHARSEATLQRPATPEAREALVRKYRKLVRAFGCSTDRIQSRYAFPDDFSHQDWDRMRLFELNAFPSGRSCAERSRFFAEVTAGLFRDLYPEAAEAPPVLIHVTCTGYVAPSAAQRLVARRDWGRRTEVIHAYHMGCSAALPAIRMAAGFLADGKARVDVVHTELCTLHLDPALHTPEQLVVQTLFADGVMRYALTRAEAWHGQGRALELLAAGDELLPGTEDAMTWMVHPFAMRMTLSRKVPDLIRGHLAGFLDRLAARAGFTLPQLRGEAVFAIHPGGPRIIDELARHLGLGPAQVEASNGILARHGNMSSATLPHVWQAILDAPGVPGGTPVVALAFGPGLTIAGAILRLAA